MANVLATIANPMTAISPAIGRQSGIFKQAIGRVTAGPTWREHDEPRRVGGCIDVGRRAQRHPKNEFRQAVNRDRVWHLGPLRRLTPRIIAEPRESEEDRKRSASPRVSDFSEQRRIEVRITQNRRACLGQVTRPP
jgi:hypothetical protein